MSTPVIHTGGEPTCLVIRAVDSAPVNATLLGGPQPPYQLHVNQPWNGIINCTPYAGSLPPGFRKCLSESGESKGTSSRINAAF